jgi:glycosyltransferase involved in cell wall biosynthesis
MNFVSIVIPCRDEEQFISRCLDCVVLQDFPKESMEVFVVDGLSKDRTKEISLEYAKKFPFIKVLDNLNKTTPFGMNLGIKKSRGEAIIILGAHAMYEKDYVSKCVKYLKDYSADNVGGYNMPVSKDEGIITKAVTKVLASSFGAGGAHYITGGKKPREVDTVFGGCFRREVFEKIGLFNERLTRSQDMEFNLRLKKAGGKIMFFPDIKSYYYPKKTSITNFFRHNFTNGIWAVYPLKIVGTVFKPRHYIPFFFVVALLLFGIGGIFSRTIYWFFIAFVSAYIAADIYFSLRIFLKEKSLALLFIVPIIFPIRHIGYGLGSLWGFLTIWKLKTQPAGLTK